MKKILSYIIIILIVLGISFGGGYFYRYKTYVCDIQLPDTTYIHDTIDHYIKDTLPWYHHVYDTTIYVDTLPFNIDTNAVVKAFYAKHCYTREWADTNISVKLQDVISRNRPIDNVFTYKILRPQVINIYEGDKITNYSRYIYIGGGINTKDIKRTTIDALYAGKKGAFGIGYAPIANEFTIKGYVQLIKIK